jgi:hypothetical protein
LFHFAAVGCVVGLILAVYGTMAIWFGFDDRFTAEGNLLSLERATWMGIIAFIWWRCSIMLRDHYDLN